MKESSLLTSLRLGAVTVLSGLTAWLGVLAMPMYILVLMNLADYITGLCAAPWRGQKRSSDRGLRGIAKKVCMWLLVGVGAAIDWLLAYTASRVGIPLKLGSLVGAAVAIWLICNEIISVLENVGDMGVRLPGFMKKLVLWVAQETETAMNPTRKDDRFGTETNTPS